MGVTTMSQQAGNEPVHGAAGELASSGQLAPDCLDSYLREIAVLPLLTAAEERRLAERAADGDAGARRQLISANLRLVVSIARRYAAYGLPLCDLIQEGNLGLIKATERFDRQRGTRFSTYAAYWIRESITRALTSGGRPVALSGHAFRRFRALTSKAQALTAALAREPTLSEVAAALQTTPGQAGRILAAAAFPVAWPAVSDGDRHAVLVEDMACECGCDPAEVIPEGPSSAQIQNAVDAVLDGRERQIIIHAFGLDGAQPRTLKQMAQGLGISIERVRQLRERALAKLRKHLTVSVGTSH